MTNLIIVESPAKIKKLASFLGPGWVVEASRGHVRDLPDDELAVGVAQDFQLQYRLIKGKGPIVNRLKKAMQAADAIYLATDPDREGEAIAWHILELTQAERRGKPVYRVTFTAITKQAVLAAVAAPRQLDLALVEAQQARRTVDRLVGYLVSPLACRLMDTRVSAGRVQSVCLRLVVEREREIAAFVPVRYWTLDARLKAPGGECTAHLAAIKGVKVDLKQKETVEQLVRGLSGAAFWVNEVKQEQKARHPLPPFTTSSLQQAASKALGFAPEHTMQVAQALYEAGLITYLRTDSVAIAPEAQEATRRFAAELYGQPYVPALPQVYESRAANAQEAHEAIRPVEVARLPDSLEAGDGVRLYRLVWQRFLASQMADAVYAHTGASITAGKTIGQPYPVEFQAHGRRLFFDGFLKVYEEALDDGELAEGDSLLPELTPGLPLTFVQWLPGEHTTQAPARYTEAALIKALEQRGIGRPSTYASMVKTIKDKGYARLEQKRLVPTDIGLKLNDFLVQRFPTVFDTRYTASLEAELDQVAGGQATRRAVLQAFWERHLAQPLKTLAGEVVSTQKTPRIVGKCPRCGGNLVERQGPRGTFAGCEHYPKCKGTAAPVRFTATAKGTS